MKFPYGNADFYDAITDGYVYIDRTDYIPLLEEAGKVLLFLRPRRFGKNLLLSMLENYYDVAKAADFARLFGHLAIGQAPTPKHNHYLILKWNFSLVATQGTVTEIQRALQNHVNAGVDSFARRYAALLPFRIEVNPDNAIASLESALTAARVIPYEVYLLIDEYDNFANEVLMAGQSDARRRYEALIQGEGLLKTLFKAVKYGTEGQGIDRVFITGVSPVVMSDVTSGFNIAKNIYFAPEFDALCGFWEHEIADVVRRIIEACALPADKATEALAMMRTFYDGYSFTYDQPETLYNPTLVLYFLGYLQKRGRYPEDMLDENLAMDRGKLAYISRLPKGEQLIWDILNERRAISIQNPHYSATMQTLS